MPPPAPRRCTFKQPNNDKYQCQKAGDKYQPEMNRWYCRFHDRHAKDRCQVLVEWAGKGAQCENMGRLRNGGKRLCEGHARETTTVDEMTDKHLPPTPESSMSENSSIVLTHPTAPLRNIEHDSLSSHLLKRRSHSPPSSSPEKPHTEPRTPRPRIDSLFTPPISSYTSPPPSPAPRSTPLHNPTSTTTSSTPDIHANVHPSKIAAVYTQCCIFLDSHGNYNMHSVPGCGHRYRELCLRKMRKLGCVRRWNCGGCWGELGAGSIQGLEK